MSCLKRATNISERTCIAAAGASPASSSVRGDLGVEPLDCGHVVGGVERLAPGQLLMQEVARHRRVALCVDRDAAQLAQARAARDRVLQPLVSLVDPHRPLHRQPLRSGAFGDEAVGVHLGLQRAPARVQCRAVDRESLRQPEQREVVVVELHVSCPCRQSRTRDE